MRVARRISTAALVLFGVVTVVGKAKAYCRATPGCGDGAAHVTGDNCFDPVEQCSAPPLAWANACVGFSVDASGSQLRHISYDEGVTAVQAAFDTWLGPVCGGERPGISVQSLGPSECEIFEYNPAGTWYGNSNTVFFADDGVPKCGSSSSDDPIGVTCNSFDANTGQMYDSDIAIDSHDYALTAAADSDLASVLLHETGHFLGLAHVSDPMNIMYPYYTGIAALNDDNKVAICAIYPPGRSGTGPCSYLPRHGFSPECASAQTKLTCSASPLAATSPSTVAWLAAVVAALALRRARGTSSQ